MLIFSVIGPLIVFLFVANRNIRAELFFIEVENFFNLSVTRLQISVKDNKYKISWKDLNIVSYYNFFNNVVDTEWQSSIE